MPFTDDHVTIAYAFLAGGMILNALKEMLPEERRGTVGAFLSGAVLFATVGLLMDMDG